jgi:toxin ParE1/3/4
MPSKTVEFQNEAIRDYESAVDWYLARSYTTASNFILEVRRATERIGNHPQRWPAGPDGTRKFVVQRFPFVIIYRELPAKILIVAIAHGKRHPKYWVGRQ